MRSRRELLLIMTAPLLIRLLPRCVPAYYRDLCYRSFILLFTFLCYMSYHLSRKPISVVKSALHHKTCSDHVYPGNDTGNITNVTDPYWCDWAPFNNSNYSDLLGALDLCYLISYAVAMFISGHIADRINLRMYLSFGMVMSGVFTIGFGLGYFYQIHALAFYVAMQVIGGAFQATGWPGVVACVGNWFGKGKRGLIMGIWNAHTSIGNILGSVIAGVFVDNNWGFSFVVPGIIIGSLGILVFFFLVPHPSDVNCHVPDHSDNRGFGQSADSGVEVSKEDDQAKKAGKQKVLSHSLLPGQSIASGHESLLTPDVDSGLINEETCTSSDVSVLVEERGQIKGSIVSRHIDTEADTEEERKVKTGESTALLPRKRHVHSKDKAVSIFKALTIPGVVEFSLCLFFAKLVSYTFLYWLPNYISVQTNASASESAYTSTIFDAGGILGGILAGYISDKYRNRGLTCIIFLVLAAPMLFLYNEFGGEIPFWANYLLLAVCGIGVNGPYALITTAVSADLGTHKTVRDNAKALGMVTAIIDGTGSIGAAIGPLLTGIISDWKMVFYMLIAADFMAALLLVRVAVKEIRQRLWGEEEDITIIVPKVEQTTPPLYGTNFKETNYM